jgi:hypothetical protein
MNAVSEILAAFASRYATKGRREVRAVRVRDESSLIWLAKSAT